MRILSIDYGEKRIGLAVCDKKEVLASRFLTLENKSLEKSIEEIKKIILEENIKKIVVGIPIGFKNKSEQTRIIEKFISKLKKNVNIPIIRIKTAGEFLKFFGSAFNIVTFSGSAKKPLSKASRIKRPVLVFGSEVAGINPRIEEAAGYRFRIEQTDKVESLNAAVAAGIALYKFYKGYWK